MPEATTLQADPNNRTSGSAHPLFSQEDDTAGQAPQSNNDIEVGWWARFFVLIKQQYVRACDSGACIANLLTSRAKIGKGTVDSLVSKGSSTEGLPNMWAIPFVLATA